MLFDLSAGDLLAYTDWERSQWREWMGARGPEVLDVAAGTGGDGRFETVRDLIRHIFVVEMRYLDSLLGRPLTDPSSIPAGGVSELFQFGERSRRDMREFLDLLTPGDANTFREFKLRNNTLIATPKKIVTHVLLHEVRHWAQVATLLRLHGFKADFHDFLFSPVMGGELRRAQQGA